MNRQQMIILAAAGVFLYTSTSAHAITVAGTDPNAYSVAPGDAGNSYTGVAELLIMRPDLGSGMVTSCSGSLLGDGYSILTAAHCLTDNKGLTQASSAYVIFNLPDGTFVTQTANFYVDPAYDGAALDPNDAAIVSLGAPAPDSATRYDLYMGATGNQIVTMAGYGFGGTGSSGYNVAAYPYGALRAGLNQYDSYLAPNKPGFNFTNDALAGQEVFIAPGDLGGPSFIDGQIAGVHSFIGQTLPGYPNSAFGDFGGDASTLYNLNFIRSVMVTPEPATIFMLGIALVVLSLLGPKSRRTEKRDRPRNYWSK